MGYGDLKIKRLHFEEFSTKQNPYQQQLHYI